MAHFLFDGLMLGQMVMHCSRGYQPSDRRKRPVVETARYRRCQPSDRGRGHWLLHPTITDQIGHATHGPKACQHRPKRSYAIGDRLCFHIRPARRSHSLLSHDANQGTQGLARVLPGQTVDGGIAIAGFTRGAIKRAKQIRHAGRTILPPCCVAVLCISVAPA